MGCLLVYYIHTFFYKLHIYIYYHYILTETNLLSELWAPREDLYYTYYLPSFWVGE